MAVMIGTQRGWLNLERYFDETPERWTLFLAAVATYLDVPEIAVREALDAGRPLAELTRARDKNVDVLKSRVTAALQWTEPSLGGLFLSTVVEHLIDAPWAEVSENLTG
jgi:hypothetical protein